jgi:D-cysteine desulfhydrase
MKEISRSIPRVDLGVRPTPVEPFKIAGLSFDVKREDVIGGNKFRGLEFLLARPAKRLLTVSTLSANQALATAVAGKKLGLETDAVIVRWGTAGRSFALLDGEAARVVVVGGTLGAGIAIARLWRPGTRFIPPGGASPRGALGYANAMLELEDVPPQIYLPLGSGNTASGVLAGLMLRGAACEVVAVRVMARASVGRIWRRARAALRLLGHDPISQGHVRLRVVPASGAYGESTPDTVAAIEAGRRVGLSLDGTYSAKALAVLFRERPESALFLLTCANH